jgi:hypothetical protein
MDERNRTIKLAACDMKKIEIFGGCAHETPLQFHWYLFGFAAPAIEGVGPFFQVERPALSIRSSPDRT